MHLNPRLPNILADMKAAAQGRDLRNGSNGLFPAKRQLIPHKDYRKCADAQIIGVDEQAEA